MSEAASAVVRVGVRLGALMLLLTLAGCGFRPVYAPPGSDQAAPVAQLASVRIEPLPDRTGQQLHNFLRDELNPDGQPINPLYRLQVDVKRKTQKLAFREDETATRANIILNSSFVLRAVEDDRVLYSGRVSSILSYNILDEPYPTLVSEQDALRRGLRELSQDIRLRLAVYFRTAEGEEL